MQSKLFKISDLEVHPYNEEKVPYIPILQLQNLKDDIEKYGLLYPLILQKGTNRIIDGKNRFQACKELGFTEVPCIEKEFEDEAELKWFILTRAAKNRNLSTAQRAALAALTVLEMREELGIRQGRPKKDSKIGTLFKGKLIQYTAREWNVSHTNVQLALNVKKVSDEFFQAMLEGEKTPAEAREFLSRLKIKDSWDKIIPEMRLLFEKGQLPMEDAVYFAELDQARQRDILAFIAMELGVAPQNVKENIQQGCTQYSELERVKKELEDIKKEKDDLAYRYQNLRDTVDEYQTEITELRTSCGDNTQTAVRVQELEKMLADLQSKRTDC